MSGLVVDNFEHALTLRGSPWRDAFKHAHKARLGPGFWASDLDLVLVRKEPPGIAAILDVKRPDEPLSFAEVLAYNDLLAIAPIYIIVATDAEHGPFTIRRYRDGNWQPSPPVVVSDFVTVCTGWDAFRAWEQSVRESGAGPRTNAHQAPASRNIPRAADQPHSRQTECG